MPPTLFAALITQVAIPELMMWLSTLHAEGRVVTEAEALAKLNMDIDAGNAAGEAFLKQTADEELSRLINPKLDF